MEGRLPIGIQDFTKLREEGYIYPKIPKNYIEVSLRQANVKSLEYSLLLFSIFSRNRRLT